jgi:RNA polymerase sigma-70 factor (ECF subfamily)
MADNLIARWVAGDKQAAEELYGTYYRRVREFVIKLGANLVDADDIAQEALVNGLDGLRAGKQPHRLTYWLLGIARNVYNGRTRIETDLHPDRVDPKARGARTLIVRREMDRALKDGLATLTSEQRKVLELLHQGNLSRKEVADRLDVPVETVHARALRAYSRLREGLSEHFTTLVLSGMGPRAVTLEEIEALRPAFRTAITARHLEDQNESLAASRLGIPLATLRARLETAYEALKCEADADWSSARTDWKARARP